MEKIKYTLRSCCILIACAALVILNIQIVAPNDTFNKELKLLNQFPLIQSAFGQPCSTCEPDDGSGGGGSGVTCYATIGSCGIWDDCSYYWRCNPNGDCLNYYGSDGSDPSKC